MQRSPGPVAVVNAGSATLKATFFEEGAEACPEPGASPRFGACRVLVDRLDVAGREPPRAAVRDGDGAVLFEGPVPTGGHDAAIEWLFGWIERERPGQRPAAVGHRVVHGGDAFTEPVRVTPEVLGRLEALVPLAPLHQPHNLAPIRFLARRFPGLPQVACFDTAFHSGQSAVERMFALPRACGERGIRRYGFHGLSYESVAARLPAIDARAASGRTVVCHLGNGASLCAMRNGRSVATTMSFTALDGLPMGTRSGAIDPGVLLHFLEQEKMPPGELADLLYRRSGLLGISGISADMRDLLASPRPEAAEAVEYFSYRIAREIGSLAAALGGLDALVFTGGIGEHAAPVRARIGELSAWLGVRIEPAANAAHRTVLHAPAGSVRVFIVPADEEGMIVRHVERALHTPG